MKIKKSHLQQLMKYLMVNLISKNLLIEEHLSVKK